jgi:hypothetical protein
LSTIDYTVDNKGEVNFKNDSRAVFRALVTSVFLGTEECPIQTRKVAADKIKGTSKNSSCH